VAGVVGQVTESPWFDTAARQLIHDAYFEAGG